MVGDQIGLRQLELAWSSPSWPEKVPWGSIWPEDQARQWQLELTESSSSMPENPAASWPGDTAGMGIQLAWGLSWPDDQTALGQLETPATPHCYIDSLKQNGLQSGIPSWHKARRQPEKLAPCCGHEGSIMAAPAAEQIQITRGSHAKSTGIAGRSRTKSIHAASLKPN